ncbi:hypothetical protein EDC01DRAFT_69329 [Geopyxis carbonaria]|nr:hypothetical protein EDC01DRAFT_69329 [Geopyxis carbonaria]
MPPKKDVKGGPKVGSSKVVADKTFGLKNKKGGKQQKEIERMKVQAQNSGTADDKRKQAEKERREREKKAAEDAKRETAELFKPVQVQKVPFGVDPKTVVCAFYKKGNCEKGKKCKFSHDLSVERKQEKKNLYQDARGGEEKKDDDITTWDEEKLRDVIKSKHGNPQTTTDKVCKHFIEAVENQKYGWFWTCPNGGDECKYRHSLPAGFVLKTKEQRAAEKALMDKSPLATLTLEDFLEARRAELTGSGTPVTEESFNKWKAERKSKKEAEEEAKLAKEATGRAMFEKGDWQNDSDADSDDEDTGDFDLAALRRETKALAGEDDDDTNLKSYGTT